MILGYELVDFEGVHMNYCVECYDKCSKWSRHCVVDEIEDAFKCDGCQTKQEVGDD